ncbi:MAG: hypothetical protein ACP5VS_09510 [Desulfomonilaceae bacterium]
MIKRRLFFIAFIVFSGFCTNFTVFFTPANSHEDIEQQRELCLQNCREETDFDDPGLWQLSADCTDKCEKRYWKKWNQQMNGLEKD